jgi:hypothetical protein
MIKPLSAIATALTMFGALTMTAMTAAPAVAAPSCSISLPAKIYIASQTTVITAHPGSDCAASDMAVAIWNVSPSVFPDSFFFLAGSLNSSYTFYSSLDRVGVLHAVPAGASSSTGNNDLTQNTPTYTVKYTTWAYVASSRAGSAVYINALIKNYSNSYAGFVRGSGRSVYLQRYLNGAWQTMLVRTANSTGQFTVGFIQPKVYQYRLMVTETSSAWGGRSGSTFR